jgi:hypothetical protein
MQSDAPLQGANSLHATREDIDSVAGPAAGYPTKLLCPVPGCTLGRTSLGAREAQGGIDALRPSTTYAQLT